MVDCVEFAKIQDELNESDSYEELDSQLEYEQEQAESDFNFEREGELI